MTGLRDSETVVDFERREQPQQASSATAQAQSLAMENVAPPGATTAAPTNDEDTIAGASIEGGGISVASGLTGASSMKSRAGQERVLNECRDLIEQSRQDTQAMIQQQFQHQT